MTDQLLLHGVLDQRLVQAARQGALSEPGKGTQVASLGIARILFQAQAASARSLASRSSSALVVSLEHRLGDEGARQRHTILLRATAQGTKTGRCSTRTNSSTAMNNW